MTDTIQQFFAAWGDTDAAARRAAIGAAMADRFVYADPRSGGNLTTLDAVCEYVAAFTDNAPGWTASVVQSDSHDGYARAVVAFIDSGEARQHGTYFAELNDAGRLTQLIGFVGAGGLSS